MSAVSSSDTKPINSGSVLRWWSGCVCVCVCVCVCACVCLCVCVLLLHAAGQLVAQVVTAVGVLHLMDDHIKLPSQLKHTDTQSAPVWSPVHETSKEQDVNRYPV